MLLMTLPINEVMLLHCDYQLPHLVPKEHVKSAALFLHHFEVNVILVLRLAMYGCCYSSAISTILTSHFI